MASHIIAYALGCLATAYVAWCIRSNGPTRPVGKRG